MSEKREGWHQKMDRTDVLLHQDDEYAIDDLNRLKFGEDPNI